jgi:uncharacterized protein
LNLNPSTEPADRIPGRSVLTFFLLVFALAWGIVLVYVLFREQVTALLGEISATHPLFILAVYSPAIAAILLVLRHTGVSGLRRFLSRLLLWRCPLPWALFLLLGFPAITFTAALLAGGVALDYPPLPALLGTMLFMLVLGPVEELGWRGYALPLLQRRMAPIWAGLVLGVIWGAWHLPAFFLSGTPQSEFGVLPFLLGSIAASVILTPLFNVSGGSILLAALFHFQLNNPLWPDAMPYDMYLYVLVAVVVIWLNRGTMFRRETGHTAVVPEANALAVGLTASRE